jgi:hypothetical protein
METGSTVVTLRDPRFSSPSHKTIQNSPDILLLIYMIRLGNQRPRAVLAPRCCLSSRRACGLARTTRHKLDGFYDLSCVYMSNTEGIQKTWKLLGDGTNSSLFVNLPSRFPLSRLANHLHWRTCFRRPPLEKSLPPKLYKPPNIVDIHALLTLEYQSLEIRKRV